MNYESRQIQGYQKEAKELGISITEYALLLILFELRAIRNRIGMED